MNSGESESAAIPRDKERVYDYFRHMRPLRIESPSRSDGDVEKYRPEQPRDEAGRWTSTGAEVLAVEPASPPSAQKPDVRAAIERLSKKVGVDPAKVKYVDQSAGWDMAGKHFPPCADSAWHRPPIAGVSPR